MRRLIVAAVNRKAKRVKRPVNVRVATYILTMPSREERSDIP